MTVFERSTPSAMGELDALTAAVQAFLDAHVDEDLGFRVALVTSEAVTNAIEHGNRMDASRSVHLRIEVSNGGGGVRVSVTDEGGGFDPEAVPDPLRASALLAEGGRGLFLMRELADELAYEDDGRRVVLTLRPR